MHLSCPSWVSSDRCSTAALWRLCLLQRPIPDEGNWAPHVSLNKHTVGQAAIQLSSLSCTLLKSLCCAQDHGKRQWNAISLCCLSLSVCPPVCLFSRGNLSEISATHLMKVLWISAAYGFRGLLSQFLSLKFLFNCFSLWPPEQHASCLRWCVVGKFFIYFFPRPLETAGMKQGNYLCASSQWMDIALCALCAEQIGWPGKYGCEVN